MPLITPLQQADQGGWRPKRRDPRDHPAFPDTPEHDSAFDERPLLGLPVAPLTVLPSLLEPSEAEDEALPPSFSLRIAFYSEHQPQEHEGPAPGTSWDARA